jgi:hypothetical protein
MLGVFHSRHDPPPEIVEQVRHVSGIFDFIGGLDRDFARLRYGLSRADFSGNFYGGMP